MARRRHDNARGSRPIRAALALLSVVLTGCSTLSVEAASERNERRLQYAEKYLTVERQCRAAGKRLVVFATGPRDRFGIPQRGDRYQCT